MLSILSGGLVLLPQPAHVPIFLFTDSFSSCAADDVASVQGSEVFTIPRRGRYSRRLLSIHSSQSSDDAWTCPSQGHETG